jgi:putative ABC transport system permease protein
MLVSVTERTREIGVRMAVGATEREVQFQFLPESILLSLLGGALGIIVGLVGCLVLGRSLQWPLQVSTEAVLIAALFSITIGIFFGYYPLARLQCSIPSKPCVTSN